MKAITNAVIFTGEAVLHHHHILIDDEKIIDITDSLPSNAIVIDLAGKNICSGFIDIQLNGGYAKNFSKTPNAETLSEMERASCDFATPYFLPTLISSPQQKILEAVDAVKDYMRHSNGVLGMHLEGPFINPQKKGAHSLSFIRKPTNNELKEIIERADGAIKVMTVAPECLTEYQLGMLLESGINIAAGHTTMTYEQAQYYFNKGICLVTHLFNAMLQMEHRKPGTVGAVFENSNVYAPVILDGGHVHYATARIASKQKGDKLFLISDASFLGRKTTTFDWDVLNIKMVDGYYRDAGGNLAGAAISMVEAVKNAKENLYVSLQEAVEMATARPAKAIGMNKKIGYIKKGYPAKFAVFDNAFEAVKLLSL